MPLARILYTASATATGGRDGRATSSDGALDVRVSPPRELDGPGEGTNPEQLFAAGYAACFLSAVQLVARRAQVTLAADTSLEARVGLGRVGAGFGLQVDLAITAPGLAREQAMELMQRAHEVCPYSTATRGNVDVTLSVA